MSATPTTAATPTATTTEDDLAVPPAPDAPGVLEAHATTGQGDVLCRVAARSHEALQQVLVDLGRSPNVVRSSSVIALSVLVPFRTLPLLSAEAAPGAGRSSLSR